jgi:hypothetical protein
LNRCYNNNIKIDRGQRHGAGHLPGIGYFAQASEFRLLLNCLQSQRKGTRHMASNRAVTFMGRSKMAVRDAGYPKLADPHGRRIEHAVILKLVTTDICGSDLHIYNGRFLTRLRGCG